MSCSCHPDKLPEPVAHAMAIKDDALRRAVARAERAGPWSIYTDLKAALDV